MAKYMVKRITQATMTASGRVYIPEPGRMVNYGVVDESGVLAMGNGGCPALYDGPAWAQSKANELNWKEAK